MAGSVAFRFGVEELLKVLRHWVWGCHSSPGRACLWQTGLIEFHWA